MLNVSPMYILNNLRDFNLEDLSNGLISGISATRLGYRSESAYEMTVPQASVDVAVSNSSLEHIPFVPKPIEAVAKVAKPGGYGAHFIDLVGLQTYGMPEIGPLDFFQISSNEPLIHGWNRLRPKDFISIFQNHDFDILQIGYSNLISLSEDKKNTFVLPWPSIPIGELTPIEINITVNSRK